MASMKYSIVQALLKNWSDHDLSQVRVLIEAKDFRRAKKFNSCVLYVYKYHKWYFKEHMKCVPVDRYCNEVYDEHPYLVEVMRSGVDSISNLKSIKH